MYLLIWEYAVRPDEIETFLYAYGPDGAWARLFATAEGYSGTTLYRGTGDPTTFITVDRWENEAAWLAFRSAHDHEYQSLDQEFAELTRWERRLAPPD
jgi:heme-degrading monooxygenase HmoA